MLIKSKYILFYNLIFFMVNTKIKKVLAVAAISAITMTSAYAATQIGTGSVT
jgi:hypothetical protein